MSAAIDAAASDPLPNKRCGACRRWVPSMIGWSARFGLCEVRPGTLRYSTSESACDVNSGNAFAPLPPPKGAA
jgi:hypothetical protein